MILLIIFVLLNLRTIYADEKYILGSNDPGGCDFSASSFEYSPEATPYYFIIGGSTKSMTRVLGYTTYDCFDQGVAMLYKIKRTTSLTTDWAKYFSGTVIDENMGSYTNIPIVQIPRFFPATSTPPNVNYHSDNIGIAFLEYRTKTNLKDTSKNLLIYFNITNGDILK
jgi:hypothetical protein